MEQSEIIDTLETYEYASECALRRAMQHQAEIDDKESIFSKEHTLLMMGGWLAPHPPFSRPLPWPQPARARRLIDRRSTVPQARPCRTARRIFMVLRRTAMGRRNSLRRRTAWWSIRLRPRVSSTSTSCRGTVALAIVKTTRKGSSPCRSLQLTWPAPANYSMKWHR